MAKKQQKPKERTRRMPRRGGPRIYRPGLMPEETGLAEHNIEFVPDEQLPGVELVADPPREDDEGVPQDDQQVSPLAHLVREGGSEG